MSNTESTPPEGGPSNVVPLPRLGRRPRPRPARREIVVRGAREHNLRNVDVTIPRDALVVFTGLSGSGKSSLAFDTIYAEGQRRYVESLSPYARQFLEVGSKPDVDRIDGLSPAVSIEQKTTSKNPRSTVATVTEVHDYMRLLWARVGVPHSPTTGRPIEAQTVSQMVDRVMALPEGTRVLVLAPVVRGRKGEFRKEVQAWAKDGYRRVRVDGAVHDVEDVPALDKALKHDVEVVVDRLAVGEGVRTRLSEAIEASLGLADGLCYVDRADLAVDAPGVRAKGDKGRLSASGEGGAVLVEGRLVLSSRFACPVSGFTIPELEPRLFSFNQPIGCCPHCKGIGSFRRADPEKVVPNPDLSVDGGAVAPFEREGRGELRAALRAVLAHLGASPATPWRDLPEDVRAAVVRGTAPGVEVPGALVASGGRRYPREGFRADGAFLGVLAWVEDRYERSDNSFAGKAAKASVDAFRSDITCARCDGTRLGEAALSVRVCGASIGAAAKLSIADAASWFRSVENALEGARAKIGALVLKEIRERLGFLLDVGLDYLTLDRTSATLSGGESQRIRLASQVGSGLTGMLYVLDEPSIGLHQRDNERLLGTLLRLRDLGNTVIVVEHDEDAILVADHVVDVGPAAGVGGGRIVGAGTAEDLMANGRSLTGRYLRGDLLVSPPRARRPRDPGRELRVLGARGHNLKNVDAAFPLGLLTVVTGVSGGGKSTLVLDTLHRAVARRLAHGIDVPEPHERIEGVEHLDKVVEIDQSPIGRTPRSNPATYVGAFDHVRAWFAGLPEAKARGYAPGRFSFNVKGGRCEACQGEGIKTVSMQFLPDVEVACEVCHGRRFEAEMLKVTHRGRSIADVLDMPISEAAELFDAVPAIRDKLRALVRVGLGYVKVGQPATTLSGGEAQRVKLAKELSRRSTGRTLYVLDEPTTGLHFHDCAKLLELLQELVDGGNTAIVIEHNLEVAAAADWLIDMGPEGGDRGGEIVATGTPEEVVARGMGCTAPFLADVMERRSRPRQAAE